ncbi:MAG: glycosyltransferase family 4 protein, partial [Solirubrobacteraceae bacterium]
FALFLIALAQRLDRLVIAGKVGPGPGVAHYELPPETGFVELPYFPRLTDPVPAVRGMLGSLTRFWRVLGEVDGVWLLGPHPLAIAFALLALVRRRSVTLGVRQDFPRYVRARHPGRRWVWAAGDVLEAVWRALARRLRVVVVGPELAEHYPPKRTLELTVSLVRAEDIVPAGGADRAYDGDELRVLSVGRLEEEKNPLLLAEIMAGLRASDPRWRMLVCGEGPLESELRRRLSELGVADHVDLLGYVPHDRGLREIYRSSHALLHVSWTEGLPQVLFEAFAARLPVVATAVGGVAAAAGEAALLVEPGDARQPVAALARVAAEPDLRRRLTEAGAQRVASRTLEAEAARVARFLDTRADDATG